MTPSLVVTKPFSQAAAKPILFSIDLMEKNKRRERFRAFFEGPPFRGDRAALMRATGLTKGRVAQLLDDSQPFGEKAGAALAEKLGLPANYFDREPPTVSADEPVPPQTRDMRGALTREEFLARCANLSTPDWQLTARLMVAVGILPGVVEGIWQSDRDRDSGMTSGIPEPRAEVSDSQTLPRRAEQ